MPKILIAEDDISLAKMYSLRFKFESYEVIVAHDGKEALEKISKEKPDLIILDIMMPKKTGMEVLEEIKEKEQFSNIPVIILTALSNPKMQEKAQELEAKYFVKSEILLPKLVEIVKEELRLTVSK